MAVSGTQRHEADERQSVPHDQLKREEKADSKDGAAGTMTKVGAFFGIASKGDAVEIGKEIGKDFGEHQIGRQAAATAYHFLFASVPLMIFVFSLAATIGRRIAGTEGAVNTIMDWVFDRFPRETAIAVEEPIRNAIEEQGGGILTVGFVLAIWGARNAMSSLIAALNVAYRAEDSRNIIKKQLIAIALTFGTALSIILVAAFLLLGPQIGQLLAGPIGLGDTFATVWLWIRFPIVLVMLVLSLGFLYWAAPNVNIPFKMLTPGAVIAIVALALAMYFLNLYFRFFGGYVAAYGVLGGVLAFVFWLYLLSLILLLGGEINAVIARRTGRIDVDPDDDQEAKQKPDGDRDDRRDRESKRVLERVTANARSVAAVADPRPAFRGSGRGRQADDQARVVPATTPIDPERDRVRRERGALRTLGLAGIAVAAGFLGRRLG